MLLVLAMMCSGKSCAGAQSIVPCPLVDYFVSVCCCCAVLLQLPGSAHDMAVQGYGFTYDYIDPSYPAAAKVRQLRHALLQSSPLDRTSVLSLPPPATPLLNICNCNMMHANAVISRCSCCPSALLTLLPGLLLAARRSSSACALSAARSARCRTVGPRLCCCGRTSWRWWRLTGRRTALG